MVHYPTIIERKTILKPPARSTMYTSSRAVLRRTFPNLFLCKSRVYIYIHGMKERLLNDKGIQLVTAKVNEGTDGRTRGRAGRRTKEGTNERTNGWVSDCWKEWTNEWMNEWTNDWLIEWMAEWMAECLNDCWMHGWMLEWLNDLSWFELNWNWIELILNWTNEWRVEGALERLSC